MSAPIRRCGIFGGTFDPIHLGHVKTVRQVMQLAALDQVRYIPAAVPPHRDHPGASAGQRLDMAQIAVANQQGFLVDDIELSRAGPSYTIDTIESLQDNQTDDEFVLILGLDALLGLNQWHRWQSILEKVDILAMVRPGYTLPASLPLWLQEAGFDPVTTAQDTAQNSALTAKIQLLPIQPTAISATAIRDAIQNGADISAMLHPGVWQYIQSNQLYVKPDRQHQ